MNKIIVTNHSTRRTGYCCYCCCYPLCCFCIDPRIADAVSLVVARCHRHRCFAVVVVSLLFRSGTKLPLLLPLSPALSALLIVIVVAVVVIIVVAVVVAAAD